MVLRGDIASFVVGGICVDVLAGLVLGAVTEFEFVCFGSGRNCEDLVSHADAEDRFFEWQAFSDCFVEWC